MAGKVRQGRVRKQDVRGRQVLLWALAFFFAIQLGAGLLLDYRWPELRFPTAGLHFRNLQAAAQTPDIIFFGSSRFGMGINATAVRQGFQEAGAASSVAVYNASIEAGDLVTADYMLRELGRRGTSPDQVVLEISPETVTRYNRWILDHIRRQITWTDIPRYLADICKAGQLKRLLQARFLPLYVHRHQILKQTTKALANFSAHHLATEQQLANPAVTADLNIKLYSEPPPAGVDATYGGLREVPSWLRSYQAGGGNSEVALERILQRCHKRGIKVLLVGVPVSTAHRGLYTQAIEDQFRDYIERVVKTYACEYVDFRARVPDHLFLDHHHLSPQGCIHFSRLLAKEVLAPVWNASKIARRGAP